MAGDPHWASVILAMHMDGADASTVFTDIKGKAITRSGTPTISTAQSKFGGASLALNGSSQYLILPNTTDFDFPGAFTIDGWVRMAAYNASWATLFSRYTDSPTAGYRIILGASGAAWQLSFVQSNGSVNGVNGATLSLNTWHHIEVGFDGSTYYAFTNGVLNSTFVALAPKAVGVGRSPYIGTTDGNNWLLNGNVDDFRITKGVCRHTASFTPETSAFAEYASYIAGTVKDDTGALCARTIRAYRRSDGSFSGSTVSNATTGVFSCPVQAIDAHTVIALDDTAGTAYNALVFDNVTPI